MGALSLEVKVPPIDDQRRVIGHLLSGPLRLRGYRPVIGRAVRQSVGLYKRPPLILLLLVPSRPPIAGLPVRLLLLAVGVRCVLLRFAHLSFFESLGGGRGRTVFCFKSAVMS